jgi:putative ABC transport system permease protein
MLLKSPGFTAAAVISLALGIGANTAIFSVINAVLLKSLPYDGPDSIMLVWGDRPSRNEARGQVSATDVHDWRARNTVFEEITTYSDWSAIMSENDEPERVPGMQVGDGYFAVMRGSPLIGRVFLPEEQEEGKDFVIVLSHGLWQRRFGGDPEVVGKTVLLSSRPYTVVGVMPADFKPLPTSLVTVTPQFYRPVAEAYDEEARGSRHLRAIARLKPVARIEQAQAEMSLIARQIEQEHPDSNTDYGVRVTSLTEDTVGTLRPALLLLLGAVAFVLLIACANVGNLLLARSTARQREIAIRAALGAGRARLVRQFLTESVMLALGGGGLGLLFALWGNGAIEAIGSKVIPLLNNIEINMPVLAFTLVISFVTGIAFGLAPALHVSSPDLNESLKEGGRGTGAGVHTRLRSVLVVSEVALALVLLVSAGLLIKSVVRLRDVDPGFNPENVLTMDVWLPRAKYRDSQKWVAFYDQITSRIEALPSVRDAGLVSVLPLGSNFDGRAIQVEDHPVQRGEEPEAELYITTPGYLEAMHIGLLKGRSFDERDAEGAPLVALVSEAMVERYWPDQDPIGKRIRFPGSESRPEPWRTIVGVVSDVKQRALDAERAMQMYLPEAQYPTSALTLVVRTASDPASMAAAVSGEIRAVDKDQPVSNVATMEQLRWDSISLRRFSMLLLGIFAAVALTLAAIGIYGVISYSVTQRTREIGIRMALGAQRRHIFKVVVGQGMIMALIGIAVGLAVALALTRVMSSLLFGVAATDPGVFTIIPLLLGGVALLASYIPARRATKVDPMIALRYE